MHLDCYFIILANPQLYHLGFVLLLREVFDNGLVVEAVEHASAASYHQNFGAVLIQRLDLCYCLLTDF